MDLAFSKSSFTLLFAFSLCISLMIRSSHATQVSDSQNCSSFCKDEFKDCEKFYSVTVYRMCLEEQVKCNCTMASQNQIMGPVSRRFTRYCRCHHHVYRPSRPYYYSSGSSYRSSSSWSLNLDWPLWAWGLLALGIVGGILAFVGLIYLCSSHGRRGHVDCGYGLDYGGYGYGGGYGYYGGGCDTVVVADTCDNGLYYH